MMPRLATPAVLFTCALTAGAASAQVPGAIDPFETARGLYRDRAYAEAVPYIVEAIQQEPQNPRYYVGLARAYYALNDFESATYFYDIYLTQLRDYVPGDVREQDRIANVRRERDEVNAERHDPSASPALPSDAGEARGAFFQRLDAGPVVGLDRGGAWAMYETLLRVGYAHPDLVEIRRRLAEALQREVNDTVDDATPALPVLSMAGWSAQQQRITALLALQPPAAATDIPIEALDPEAAAARDPAIRLRAHEQLCAAQIHALNQNYRVAAAGFRAAREAWPGLLPAWVGELGALAELRGATPEAELAAFEARLQAVRPAEAGLADVLRAVFAARGGDVQRAAALLAASLHAP